jgi:hypothetical protein
MVKRRYSSSKSEGTLHPWFVTGYTDGEGSFSIRLRTKSSSIFGYHVSIVYSIPFHINISKILLKKRNIFQNCGLRGYGTTATTKRDFISQTNKLNPGFVTGFTDGEGNFAVSFCKDNKYKTGWRLQLVYQIVLHSKDLDLLESIKNFFGVGKISQRGTRIHYRVQAIKDFEAIFNHFDKYPLITNKWADYILFKEVYNLINDKQHTTIEGLKKIIAIKSSINLGLLSDELKAAFPNVIPVLRPSVLDCKIKNPNWLAGFASAEGSFMINILNSSSNRTGYQVSLVFQLTQHIRDEVLMRNIIDFLDCGLTYRDKEAIVYRVYNFTDLYEKILPFFQKYQIQGIKLKDYLDFISALDLLKNKAHLTPSGLDQIRKIKAGMNRSRSEYKSSLIPSVHNNSLPGSRRSLSTQSQFRFMNAVLEGSVNPLNLKLLERVKDYFGGVGSISKSGNMFILPSRGSLQRNKGFYVSSQNFIYLGSGLSRARHYSSVPELVLFSDKKPNTPPLNPHWVTGFSDGEASFIITISKHSQSSRGWIVTPSFQICLHVKDIMVLESIQKFFGVGRINKRLGRAEVSYSVTKNTDLLGVIIPYFDKYSLISKKKADFILFKSAVLLCSKKEHLNKEGLNKIVCLRASMNKGLTEILKKEFPGIVPVNRPNVHKPSILNPYWVSGFIAAEGCFYVTVYKSKNQIGYSSAVNFIVTQHFRDLELIESLITFFNCGQIKKDSRDLNSGVSFNVTKFSDISDKVLPFLEKYPIIGNKFLDYKDFYKVCLLIKEKGHLTPKGLEEIRKIKAGMNSSRSESKSSLIPSVHNNYLPGSRRSLSTQSQFRFMNDEYDLNLIVGSIGGCSIIIPLRVSSLKALINVRKHFEQFPRPLGPPSSHQAAGSLQTTKFVHFKLWCKTMDILEKKEHLSESGFYKILSIKSVFPKGLSAKLLELHPKKKYISIIKPVFEPSNAVLDKYWITGFAQADGTFGLNYSKQARMKLGYTCLPQFRITQHERDLIVLKRIVATLGCGTLVKPTGDRDRYTISVASISDLVNIIIPLFEQCPIYGAKYKDFLDFARGIQIIKEKGHLTLQGLNELKDLAYGMNTYRKFVLNSSMCSGYFILPYLEHIVRKSCRWLMWINQLWYRYMLELPYIEFIYILSIYLDKINKKILCFIIEFSIIKGVNKQETSPEGEGSSETIRGITYNFEEYSYLKPQHKKKINRQFLEWFIGFTEGDGSFIVSKNKVYFDITQNISDVQVLYFIKKELGFGKVLLREEENRKVGVFYVSSKENFTKLMHIFNGNLSTYYKKEQFKVWLNTHNKQYDMNITFKDQLIRPSLHSGWISGFADAEGCFYGRVKSCITSKLRKRPHLTFQVSQKEFDIIKTLRDIFLNTETLDLKNVKYDKSWNGWTFHCSSFTKLKIIRNYFSRYKLKTKKSLSFMKWCKIHDMVLNKQHLTLEGLNKIDLLTKDVNKFIS